MRKNPCEMKRGPEKKNSRREERRLFLLLFLEWARRKDLGAKGDVSCMPLGVIDGINQAWGIGSSSFFLCGGNCIRHIDP